MSEQGLYTKLAAAKNEIGTITKTSKNPFFKSNYADINAFLATVEPILLHHQLLLVQPIENGTVYTRIIDPDTGNKIESGLPLPEAGNPQDYGSAITYYRRYTLQSLLALQAEDDDGNQAREAVQATTNSRQQQQTLKKQAEKLGWPDLNEMQFAVSELKTLAKQVLNQLEAAAYAEGNKPAQANAKLKVQKALTDSGVAGDDGRIWETFNQADYVKAKAELQTLTGKDPFLQQENEETE